MKKTLVALAALAAASAFAQSSVTIGGSASIGLTDTGAVNQNMKAASLGGGMNAINMNATEDLGGGMKAGFDSQIRFNSATGDVASTGTGNALFHSANVFLTDAKLGTVRAGKIAEASACAYDPWGCGGGAAMMGGETSTIGAAGSGLVGALSVANGVAYTSPTVAGFSFGYLTSQGGIDRAVERRTTNVNYANGPLTAQYLYIAGSSNTAANGANSSATYTAPTDANATATSLAASYDLKVVKLMVSNNITKNATEVKTFDITTYALTAPLNAKVTLLGGYSKDKIAAANAQTKTSVGVNYALSKRTTLGADVYKNEAFESNGYVVRMRHTF